MYFSPFRVAAASAAEPTHEAVPLKYHHHHYLLSSVFSANTLSELSFDNAAGADDFYGKVRNVQVFTEALTDEQLEKLTS